MAHDVFISYSNKDSQIANALCHKLEEDGTRCWIAPRDIAPGANWAESIVNAISASTVLVLIFSSHADKSKQVIREVEMAINNNLILIPLRIEDVMPSGSMSYFLSTMHWIDAIDSKMEGKFAIVSNRIKSLLHSDSERDSNRKDSFESADRQANANQRINRYGSDATSTKGKSSPAENRRAHNGKRGSFARKPWMYVGFIVLCAAAVTLVLLIKNRAPIDKEENAIKEEITANAVVAAITPETDDAAPTPTAASFSGDDITIGVISSNLGEFTKYGEAMTNAVDLAVSEINTAGGISGHKITIINADDHFHPNEAIDAFNSLASQGARLIIGSISSDCTAAITDAANREGIVLITPSSTKDCITTKDDYIFRACYADSYQGAIAAYWAKETGYHDVGVVYCASNGYSMSLYDAFSEAAAIYGMTITNVESTNALEGDCYTIPFTNMVKAGVQFVYAPFYYDIVGQYIVPQARDAGYNGIIMGSDGYNGTPDEIDKAEDLTAFNDVYWTNHYDPSDKDLIVQKFVAAYEAMWNSTPNAIAALTYDAVYMLKQAIESAGSDSPIAVRDALSDTTVLYAGVTGNFSLDSTGTPRKGAAIISFSSDGVSVTTKLIGVIRYIPAQSSDLPEIRN